MHAVHTRQTLMTRIIETQRQSALTRDERNAPRRQKPSFTERYRGTEFDTHGTRVVEARAPLVSRGRAFVLIMGTAALSVCGLVVSAALSA